jgi:hypothetical protein
MALYRTRNRPSHPKASSSGCVYDHVLVAEAALGRTLPDCAQIHHVNGDKHDNSRSNLVICQDIAYHRLLHVRERVLRHGGNPNTDATCSKCRQAKHVSKFNKFSANKAQGVQKYCRDCMRVLGAQRRAKAKKFTNGMPV